MREHVHGNLGVVEVVEVTLEVMAPVLGRTCISHPTDGASVYHATNPHTTAPLVDGDFPKSWVAACRTGRVRTTVQLMVQCEGPYRISAHFSNGRVICKVVLHQHIKLQIPISL